MDKFNFDKETFGDKLPEVEKLVEQAMSYATKKTATEKETFFAENTKKLQEQLQEKENQIKGVYLNSVPEENKKLVETLMGSSDIETIKTDYPHLFKTLPLADIGGVLENITNLIDDEDRAILSKIADNQQLTKEEMTKYASILLKQEK